MVVTVEPHQFSSTYDVSKIEHVGKQGWTKHMTLGYTFGQRCSGGRVVIDTELSIGEVLWASPGY